MIKNISITFLAGLLSISGYVFGTICRRFELSYELLFAPSKDLFVLFVWYLLAAGVLLVLAGLAAALLRAQPVGFLVFGIAGMAMLLGWKINLFSGTLILIFIVAGILHIVGAQKELSERIKFSVKAVCEQQGLLLIALTLLASASLYPGLDMHIKEEGLTIPETYVEFFMDQMENGVEAQTPPEEREQALAEFRAHFQRTMDRFIEDTLKPYEQFIPLGIVVVIFMSLMTVTRFLTWIPALMMNLIFRVLEYAGITRVVHEEIDVQRLVLG